MAPLQLRARLINWNEYYYSCDYAHDNDVTKTEKSRASCQTLSWSWRRGCGLGTRLICDMFTSSSHVEDKERILSQFTNPNGTLCVVATIVFGMGIDAPMFILSYTGGLLSQSKTMFRRVAGVYEME